MKESTQNWITVADKELKLAKACLDVGEPIGIIYHLHACIEKALKAICEESQGNPPKIHSLKRLAVDTCGITLAARQARLIQLLDKAFMDSRYPDDLVAFEEAYDIEFCGRLIEDTKETVKWLKSLLKSN